MRSLCFAALLAATSSAAATTTTFTGPSLSIEQNVVYATSAGTASWEVETVDSQEQLKASYTLSMTLAAGEFEQNKQGMVAVCTPLLQTRYCSLMELNKPSAEEYVITAYWKTHAIDKVLP